MQKADRLIRTKLHLPFTRLRLVSRPRLQEQIAQGLCGPLTLITAPAGFGKTTLVASCVASCGMPIAWLSLDKDDNQAERFLNYLVAALQGADNTIGSEAAQLLAAAQQAPLEAVVTGLINDLDIASGEIVLVLDDYQFIKSQAVHEAVAFLLEHCPKTFHLVIASRSDPPLPLARLRARDQTVELRAADLSFTEPEAAQFLNDVMGLRLDAGSVAVLKERTEGWIAGLQMAALSMRNRKDVLGFIEGFSGTNRYILDYLLEEVLASQPLEIQRFLLGTSILERLTAPLCEAVLANDEGREREGDDRSTRPESLFLRQSASILEYLERANLFLVPLDDERQWYRYHHLFADLLRVRLRQHEPKLEAVLNKRAANWYAQNSYSFEAVRHALNSGDYSFAADLMEEYSLRLIWMNQIVTTLDWFKLLPPEVVESHPLLMIYQTFMLARRGEFERVETILANAEASIKTMPGSQKIDEYKILIFGMRAFMANLRGDSEKAIQFSLGISPVTKNQVTTSYIMARAQLAVAYLETGDISSAERVFTDIVQWAQESQDVYYAILTNKELAEIWILRGRLSQTEQLYKQMYNWIQQTVQKPAVYNGLIKVYEASLLIEKNDLESARRLMQEDIESILSVWRTTSLYFGYTVMAYLYTGFRDFQQARVAIEKAIRWVTSQSLYLRNRSMVQACQVNLWLAEGNLAEAQNWTQSNFPQIPTDLPFIRELDHICLARILVASCRWAEALDLLQRLSFEAEAGKRLGRLLKINILRALTLDGLGRFEEALELLDGCLYFAYPEGYVRVFLDEGRPMQLLLAQWLAHVGVGPLRDYAIRLLSQFDAEPSVVTAAQEKISPTGVLVEPLSQRELEVLHLIAVGRTNQEIARQLIVSPGTVKAHTSSIYRKLDVANRTEAVARARQLGILP